MILILSIYITKHCNVCNKYYKMPKLGCAVLFLLDSQVFCKFPLIRNLSLTYFKTMITFMCRKHREKGCSFDMFKRDT